MKNEHWILCPACGSKTRDKIREDTVLKNFPLYAEPMTCEIPRRSSALFFEKQLYDCSFG